MRELTTVDEDGLRDELPQVEEHLAKFGDRLPDEVRKAARSAEAAPGLSAAGAKTRRLGYPLASQGVHV